MRTMTERIFETTIDKVNKNDLTKVIGKTESLELEFKEIVERIPSKAERKEKILQPLVSFLNSSKGSGLLILGIKEGKRDIAKEIVGVKPNLLSQLITEGSLETYIYHSINSIPSEIIKFELEVKLIPWSEDKNVYLIEINRNDPYCIYSSGVTARVYVREGRKSPGLTFNQAIDLVSKKNYPRPYVDIEFLNENKGRDKKSVCSFSFSFINKGTKPASNISIVYFICSDTELEIVEKPQFGFDINDIELEKFDLINIENYSFRVAYNHLHKNRHPVNDLPIYPLKRHGADILSLKYSDELNFDIYTLIFEENATTKQEFHIHKEIEQPAIIKEDVEKQIFQPYMTL